MILCEDRYVTAHGNTGWYRIEWHWGNGPVHPDNKPLPELMLICALWHIISPATRCYVLNIFQINSKLIITVLLALRAGIDSTQKGTAMRKRFSCHDVIIHMTRSKPSYWQCIHVFPKNTVSTTNCVHRLLNKTCIHFLKNSITKVVG